MEVYMEPINTEFKKRKYKYMIKVLAIIPARSESKSVKDKNIRLIMGKPMMAFSIEHALKSKYINRVIVSTDSERYAKIAREYGAEVPFLRPLEYATDTALDIDVFKHALNYLQEKEDYFPDIIVQLRPTYPIRNVDDIDKMIEVILDNRDIDSVRTITSAKEIPYKMWTKEPNGQLKPIITNIPECYNMPRQKLPKVYYQNACIDVIRPSVITNKKSMSGTNVHGYVMDDNFDIDTEKECLRASTFLKIISGKNTFCFDIDGVVALFRDELDYTNAQPNPEMIEIINRLYDYGNEIILFTARGYLTGIDWRDITQRQMNNWGVSYTELKFGKPAADFYIDDHSLTIEELVNLFRKKEV